jgi:hypothetical protein
MLIKPILFATTLFISIVAAAQRDLEVVAEWPGTALNKSSYKMVTVGATAYLAGFYRRELLELHDRLGVRTYPYPETDRYRYFFFPIGSAPGREHIVAHEGKPYFILTGGDISTNWLATIDGSRVVFVANSNRALTIPVVYKSKLYIIRNASPGPPQLSRYDGGGIFTDLFPISYSTDYLLKADEDYLYFGTLYGGDVPLNIFRYDGTNYAALPRFHDYHNSIEKTFSIAGESYFISRRGDISYYNGTELPYLMEPAPDVYNFYAFDCFDSLCVFRDVDSFHCIRRGLISTASLPTGTKRNMIPVVNEGSLLIPVSYARGDNRILRYDGTSFSEFLRLPPEMTKCELISREGKVVIQELQPYSRIAYEYDGDSLIALRAPEGHVLYEYVGSTNCYHYWVSYYYNEEGRPNTALLRESKGCPPPSEPLPPPDLTIVPEHFRALEKFNFYIGSKERGWCWNEIIIDWDIKPCPRPPCPVPGFDLRALDSKGKDVWKYAAERSSSIKVPLPDKQGFRFTMSTLEKPPQGLLLLSDDLVEKGIESISFEIKPDEKYFLLKVYTKNKKQVPILLELLDKQGNVIWKKEFKAPFADAITDQVKEPGQALRFSIPGADIITLNEKLPTNKVPATKQTRVVRQSKQ